MDTDSDTDSSDDFRSAHSVASVTSVTPSDESEKENANSASSPRSFVTARSFTASSSSGAASNAANAANAVKKKVSFSAALASAFAPSPTPSNIHSTAKDLPLLQSDADLPPAFRAPLATTTTATSPSTSVNIEDFDADDDDDDDSLSTVTATTVANTPGVIIGTSLQRAVQTDYSDGTWRYRQSLRMAVQALTCLVIGELVFGLLLGIPVSKNLWTPSFLGICLFFSIAGFGWCFWVVDGQPNVQSVVVVGGVGRRRIGVPSEQTRLLPGGGGGGRNGVSGRELPLAFNVLASCGRNPLFLFVLHELVAAFLGWIGWYEPLYEYLFGWISVDGVGSLLWSLAWGLLVYAPIGVYLDHIRWYWRM
ncbi:hypothetical protein HDU99_001471 [Rhizoclosmatium hyalinum]|nr:hypothetical protein HDU99_001471 [Rhizoclosmatium hyalinum]